MTKNKVIIEELQPGVLRYMPAHKKSVMAAMAGYFEQRRTKKAGKKKGKTGEKLC